MWRIAYFFQNWLPDFWQFIRHIPGYYRMEVKEYGYDPKALCFIINQYMQVVEHMTGGRMSKPTYYAREIITLSEDHWCDGCEYRERYEKEDGQDD